MIIETNWKDLISTYELFRNTFRSYVGSFVANNHQKIREILSEDQKKSWDKTVHKDTDFMVAFDYGLFPIIANKIIKPVKYDSTKSETYPFKLLGTYLTILQEGRNKLFKGKAHLVTKDEATACWHCFKEIAKLMENSSLSCDIETLYKKQKDGELENLKIQWNEKEEIDKENKIKDLRKEREQFEQEKNEWLQNEKIETVRKIEEHEKALNEDFKKKLENEIEEAKKKFSRATEEKKNENFKNKFDDELKLIEEKYKKERERQDKHWREKEETDRKKREEDYKRQIDDEYKRKEENLKQQIKNESELRESRFQEWVRKEDISRENEWKKKLKEIEDNARKEAEEYEKKKKREKKRLKIFLSVASILILAIFLFFKFSDTRIQEHPPHEPPFHLPVNNKEVLHAFVTKLNTDLINLSLVSGKEEEGKILKDSIMANFLDSPSTIYSTSIEGEGRYNPRSAEDFLDDIYLTPNLMSIKLFEDSILQNPKNGKIRMLKFHMVTSQDTELQKSLFK